jgi:hypothetical protein
MHTAPHFLSHLPSRREFVVDFSGACVVINVYLDGVGKIHGRSTAGQCDNHGYRQFFFQYGVAKLNEVITYFAIFYRYVCYKP